MDRRLVLSPESSQASEIFDKFCNANTLKLIILHYRQLCQLLHLKATHYLDFYPKIKSKLVSWRANGLWTKLEKRSSAKCYIRGKACTSSRVLIIGAGPCGLRAAIEAQFLGAKVVLIEKRDRFSRNNVLHLWPFVIADLKGLGAKKFYGKFCAGSIDHISIRQLQCILLKVALLIGVEIHEGVGFEGLCEPTENEGWRAITSPSDHPVSHYHFDCLIGADGRRNTLEGFRRKALRAKLAIAITANFINKRTEAEARVKEISGVSYIFNQKFFQDLNEATGIDLENIVYYKDETHYFVMTAKKQSLLNKGVLLEDHADTAKLLSHENISTDQLMVYAVEAALFSTENQLDNLEFAVNHYGQPDVAMFDFTAMYAAENACRVVQRKGYKLMMTLVGDSLLEPFWPTGSGCARGFLSSFDACWMLRSWASGTRSILEVIAERESIYRLLGQTTPENLNKEHSGYTIDPYSRYPNLNLRVVMPFQVKSLFDTDEIFPDVLDSALEHHQLERHRPKRRRDSMVAVDSLLNWLRTQVASYGIELDGIYDVFARGDVLCAIIYRFRPDLLEFPLLSEENVNPLEIAACRNQLAFDFFHTEYGIAPVLSGPDSVQTDSLDYLTLIAYLSQIYEAFKGEIPQTKHLRLDGTEEVEECSNRSSHGHHAKQLRPLGVVAKHSMGPRVHRRSRVSSSTSRDSRVEAELSESSKRHRKRRSEEKSRSSLEERERRHRDLELNRLEKGRRRIQNLILQRERFRTSMKLLELNERKEESSESGPYEDYTFHLYRQTAPEWEERCKALEHKLFYGGKEQKHFGRSTAVGDIERQQCVPNLARDLEQKLKGGSKSEKKPKDLIRAIGKIEKSDWNVQLIEKKIAESKTHGQGWKERDDKVPKWSKEAFDDKRDAMKRRMEGGENNNNEKDKLFDETIKNLGRRLKEGNALEVGQRGSNKVSLMAGQIVDKFYKRSTETDAVKSAVTRPIFEPKRGSSEICHFCQQRVYVVEKMTAEGKYFHRNCFRCEYCNTSLRLGSYSFERDGRYGDRFYCAPHFQYIRHFGWKKYDQEEEVFRPPPLRKFSANPQQLLAEVMEDRGTTPERVEFENSVDFASEDEALSEMDEDEWTDRNFGSSKAENNTSDEASDLSEDEDEVTPEGVVVDEQKDAQQLQDNEDESSDSDTEVASGEGSTGEESEDLDDDDDDGCEDEEEDECEGSTTEIETDSEFAEDPPQTVPGKVPTIVVEEPEQLMTRFFEVQPKANPVQHPIDSKVAQMHPPIKEEQYEELKLVEPLPKVNTRETRVLPSVYGIPKKWESIPERSPGHDVMAMTKALELKKQYLYGAGPALTSNAKKPVDPSAQNQFTSVLDMISEQQKKLQPASKPSPAMQAFLEETEKLKNKNSFVNPQQPTSNPPNSPKINQLPPWSDQSLLFESPSKNVTEIVVLHKTDSMNRLNIEKTLEAERSGDTEVGESERLSSNEGEKRDAEKEVLSPATNSRASELIERNESLNPISPSPYSDSTSTQALSEGQPTIVAAVPGLEDEDNGGTDYVPNSSPEDLTASDLDEEFLENEGVLREPPRVEIEDEFGVTLAVDLENESRVKKDERAKARIMPFVMSSSESKDSLNSSLFLETEMSEWAENEGGRRRRQIPRSKNQGKSEVGEVLRLDLEDGLDFMDIDALSSPDEILQSVCRKQGYSRLFEDEGESIRRDDRSTSSNNESSSRSDTPTVGSTADRFQHLPEWNRFQDSSQVTTPVTDSMPEDEERLIPFSMAKDSFDDLKMKRLVSPGKQEDLFSIYLPTEGEIKNVVNSRDRDTLKSDEEMGKPSTSPTTARKLDELSKERATASELIKSMVMGRIRKNRRGTRGSLVRLDDSSSPPSSSNSSPSDECHPKKSFVPQASVLSRKETEESVGSSLWRVIQPAIPSPMSMFQSVTNPPTPVNPNVSIFSPRTPPSDGSGRWEETRANPPSFYGSLPNISLVTRKRTKTSGKKVTKVSSFLSPNPKKWEDHKHPITVDRERARQAARERARLKSDEELGLSPNDQYVELKDKLRRKLSVPEGESSPSNRAQSQPTSPVSPVSLPEYSHSLQEALTSLAQLHTDQVPVGVSIRNNVDFPMKKTSVAVMGLEETPRHHHYRRTCSLDSKLLLVKERTD